MNYKKKLKFILYMRSIKLSKISAYTPAFSLVLSYTIFLFGVIYTMDGQAQQEPAQQPVQQPDLTPATAEERANYVAHFLMCHSAGLMNESDIVTFMYKNRTGDITKADCADMLAKARDEAFTILSER
jgi:hypothetical protein